MEEIILLYALENAIKEGKIDAVTIRKVENRLVAEITGTKVSSGVSAKIEQKKIVLNTLAVALSEIGIYTPAVENAKGKVTPL